ncbi:MULTISPECIES: Smr/MutS family protein [unclassified Bradyrhizobium]|uniref:Smr/MutS family protein n=1 Tax=unclassified Bradyrhizobium TaxID=2631580 RepID=UPI002915FC16|nr:MULTISPECIES: Smr/MutS family protein [unclassified Bradyrhizobium]
MSHDPEPPRGRRKRGLSEDERTLWETVARQVRPLRKTQRPVRLHPPMTTSEPQPDKPAMTQRPVAPVAASKPVRPAIPPLVSLGRKERSKLSRGRNEIDARLDLHGMTQSRAHQALHHFLHRAQHDGLTFVLVITGKGTIGADPERGVLRRQVPHWLSLPEFRSLIVGFEEAHVGHGGAGALYVRIRRPRG